MREDSGNGVREAGQTDDRLVPDLVHRLSVATGPDRILDLAISVAVNFKDVFEAQHEWKWGAGGDEIEGHQGGRRRAILDPAQFVPQWTRSVDVALRLVPEGHWWSVIDGTRMSGDEYPDAKLPFAQVGLPGNSAEYERGATPAIALCIASLTARGLSTDVADRSGDPVTVSKS